MQEQNKRLKAKNDELLQIEKDGYRLELLIDKLKKDYSRNLQEQQGLAFGSGDKELVIRKIKDLNERETHNQNLLRNIQVEKRNIIKDEEKSEVLLDQILNSLKTMAGKMDEITESINELKSKRRILVAEKNACIEKKVKY